MNTPSQAINETVNEGGVSPKKMNKPIKWVALINGRFNAFKSDNAQLQETASIMPARGGGFALRVSGARTVHRSAEDAKRFSERAILEALARAGNAEALAALVAQSK